MARQNNKWQHNDATLTECEPLLVNTAALRDFLLPAAASDGASAFGALRNGSGTDSCMWLTDDSSETQPHQDRGRIISMAPCGQPGSAWKFSASSGQIASTDIAGLCVGYWVSRHGCRLIFVQECQQSRCGQVGAPWPMPSLRRLVAPVSCDGTNGSDWATRFRPTNAADGTAMMQAVDAPNASAVDPKDPDHSSPCLAIVRDNINISLAMSVTLAASNGAVITPTSRPSAVNPSGNQDCGPDQGASACADVHSVSARYSMQANTEYVLRIAVETTRGNDATAEGSAMSKALRLSSAISKAEALEAANRRAWASWFDASEVYLGEKRQYLEGFWYGAQYMLRGFSKTAPGGVIPGLLGPWSLQGKCSRSLCVFSRRSSEKAAAQTLLAGTTT